MNDHTEESNGYVSIHLTHFVGNKTKPESPFKRLCKIIRDKELRPGGLKKNNDGNIYIELDKPFSSDKLLRPEIVCFCDIPLEKEMLEVHTNKYSKFGLAFDKKWATQVGGASPVFYLPEGSCCTDHLFNDDVRRRTTRKDFFDLAAHDWIMQLNKRQQKPNELPRADNMFLWYFLCYCKFYDETLDMYDPNNYYMEREWRTIGHVPFEPENIAKILLPESFEQQFLDEFQDDASFKCLCLEEKICHT